jgi:hypothetical protein
MRGEWSKASLADGGRQSAGSLGSRDRGVGTARRRPAFRSARTSWPAGMPGSRVRDRCRGRDSLAGGRWPTLTGWHDAPARNASSSLAGWRCATASQATGCRSRPLRRGATPGRTRRTARVLTVGRRPTGRALPLGSPSSGRRGSCPTEGRPVCPPGLGTYRAARWPPTARQLVGGTSRGLGAEGTLPTRGWVLGGLSTKERSPDGSPHRQQRTGT